MADNTRVNDLQDKLLKAMDILNAQALNSISFDKTITCKIENDKNKKEGKYEVNDGNRIFAAYSNDTRLRAGDTVYVTVPEGNFENQKMIIGKKTADNDKPFNFTQPFDTFFDMTGNLAGDIEEYGLLANDIKDEHKTLFTKLEDCFTSKTILDINENTNDFPTDLINYPRLAVRADFRSWIKNAVRGNYGLSITLTTEKPNTTTGQTENGTYNYLLDSSMMYGNPYSFETYYSQEIVLDLEKQDIGRVVGIKVDFYQNANFYDKFNNPIPSSENGFLKYKTSNEYQRYGDIVQPNNVGDLILNTPGQGYYKTNSNDIKLENNLFVDNLEIYFGQDISTFNSDIVEIYTKNSNSYNKSSQNNIKEIQLRWVHLQDNTPLDGIKNSDKIKENYEIRWYRYEIGAAASDKYCGIYWKQYNPIEDKKIINLSFSPETEWQREKIKVIILVGEGDNLIPYRSNEIIFENEEEVPSYSTIAYTNALEIVADDKTNGNYFLYGQDDYLLEKTERDKERILSCVFSTSGENHTSLGLDDYKTTKWYFPQNSMIEPIDGIRPDDKNEPIIIEGQQPKYQIKNSLTDNLNNTIRCEYTLENRVYISEKEFSFGRFGTMGTEQTLVIDFKGDKNAIIINDNNEIETFIVKLYEGSNEITIPIDTPIEWSWYYSSDNTMLSLENSKTSEINITKKNLTFNSLHILKVKVGNLETYFPIPIKDKDCSYITGATRVIYKSNGEINYIPEIYSLLGNDGQNIANINWEIYCPDKSVINGIDSANFIGTIKNNKLSPCKIFVRESPVYGVQAKDNEGNILWTQPILVLQNQWASGAINAWDGESININEEEGYILSSAIAAGRKNHEDNTFSGVMIGDWSDTNTEDSIANQTGVYGFHHGAMSYAFKEDGTAFLGKDGRGRIYFNGDNATIYSKNYKTNHQGMMIDLGGDGTPYINMKNGSNNYLELAFNSNYPYIKIKSNKNTIKLSSTDEGSEIHLAQSNTEFITISSNIDKNPIQVGNNKFRVDWSGNLYANGGTFKGTLNADDGYLNNLDVTGNLSIAMDNSWSRSGPIYLYTYGKESQMGYIGFILGKDGDGRNTSNIGIKTSSPYGIVLETASNFRVSGAGGAQSNGDFYVGTKEVHFTAEAKDQYGIYARFA